MKVDWLIVGAGFTGATLAERIASQFGHRVLIVERRDHIAGNAFDYYDEHGILVHKYGPHIFHTNSKKVWDYLSQFTRWRPYYHYVLGMVDGVHIPVPFNLNSLYTVFPPRYAERLERRLLSEYGHGSNVPILRLREADSKDLRQLAEYIYQKVFLGYTVKQWGLRPDELDASVTGRVPVRVSRDDRYFLDTYQAMPKHGYTELFRQMLQHPRIKVLLNTDYYEVAEDVNYKHLVYTGPIDAFFEYKHGPLPYRSLRFLFETVDVERIQPVGTVNYPNEFDFTRRTELKHLTGQVHPKTTVVTEYPQSYQLGINEPYYPVPHSESREAHRLYLKEAESGNRRVVFAGRLADYRYYNMDQAVARALSLFEQLASSGYGA